LSGGRIAVDARIANAVTGDLRSAGSSSATLDNILDAEKELALRLFRELDINLTPAERAKVEERPTRNLAALLAYSRGVRYEAEGRSDAAAREYNTARQLDPAFTLPGARVTSMQAQTTNQGSGSGPGRSQQGEACSLARASSVAVERVNGVFVSPIGGSQQTGTVTDPSVAAQTATLTVTITTPP
jgi:hypothetical protein